MTDPIADLLTRIRNAIQARHANLVVPRSVLKIAIVRILKDEGFIEGYIEVENAHQGAIKIFPKYTWPGPRELPPFPRPFAFLRTHVNLPTSSSPAGFVSNGRK